MTTDDVLKRYLALKEVASPTPWRRTHGVYDVWAGDGRWSGILHAAAQHDMGNGDVSPPLEEQHDERVANAQFTAVNANVTETLLEALNKIHKNAYLYRGGQISADDVYECVDAALALVGAELPSPPRPDPSPGMDAEVGDDK